MTLLITSLRDLNSYTKGNITVEPTTVYRGHSSVVGVCHSREGALHSSPLNFPSHRMSTGIAKTRTFSQA
jgi:hypothetical protein